VVAGAEVGEGEFDEEEFGGLLARFTVVANVGNGGEPVAGGGVEDTETVRKGQPGEEIFFT